ncbi:hypothetical protein JRQ81_006047 [Phrynocephalus forsythii]|uniref:Helicase SRCAP n=1 Tax=Phrynocephalus forsythii TaxID=171643 RepID=A0A9Q1AW83_9SAUR|nr:hypothetical protein JRQ81_006047 [Phrynocephalus forsythii]
MRTLARHVAAENMPELEVDGQRITDRLEQSVQSAGAEQGPYSETGSPERRLGCQGTQELDGSSQWLADQNEAASQHALEQEASTATATEAFGTRGKEQERIKMQSSPHRQHSSLHAQTAADRMTGSNPVSPASSGSPGSSGSLTPPHLTHDSSLDSHLNFDVPKMQTRALVSPGMYTSPDPVSMWDKTHAEIAEQAKHEAEIENRIAEMKKEGFWSLKRLSKVPEPVRPKVHWDYLCEEMQWLSADFAQERRWKRGVARKVVRMVIRHHEEQKQKEERAKREEQAKLRRIASSIAKEVKQFWSNVEKVVQFKQQSRLEEKRKKALDLQLDFIVGQTEKYSDLLTQSLNETLPVPSKTGGSHADSAASSPPPPAPLMEDEDGDFQPHEESDDEETIEVEEQQEGNDSESRQREIELLMQESELPLEELLQSLPPQILENSCNVSPCASSSDNEEEEEEEEESDSEEEEEEEGERRATKNLKPDKPKPVTQRNKKPWKPDEDDAEFTANEEEAEDEEETIDAEEKLEGDVDHSKELDDLAKEGELPMDELLQKYAGAYASDFEVEESEISEASTSEYEVESEEDDSSRHSVESEQEESEEEDGLEEEETSVSQEEDFGVEYLLKQDEDRSGEGDNDAAPAPGPKKEITDIAAAAESLQPKGYTLATTQVKTPIPCLLRGTLREYQHIGLDWLVTMYEKKLNGILADEMGLGKTIQTISLLAHLACEKGSWGPHLIIVPTSVILNWEMEIKRWCPSFKILTYYGAQKERKLKRQGWTKPNAFHICITSYKLVLQDHQAFRRKNWKYLILDEAQNIKNFKSQRWQSLLNFNSQRRLLLTGTPLQNSLMELWSLMHFLMPHVFQSHREFKEWFSNPLTGMIEGSQEYNENLVKRLHKVLRPFLLRRVKVDVEKQMPKKYEHVIKCRLSKRQRYLYDDFMAQAATKETLATGHFMSVINILMQLRKVCNHPNLFDPRPIHSPFITEGICFRTASLVLHVLDDDPFKRVDLGMFDLINLEGRVSRYETDTFLPKWKVTRKLIEEIAESPDPPPRPKPVKMKVNRLISERTVEENILKKANQKRMLGDMAIEGGNFTTAYFKQQTIRELFDMPLDEPAKKEGEAPVVVQEDDEDPLATKQTQILEQALCKAEDPEDIRAATKAKAEQVAELAEFNENIPLDMDDRPSKEEEEEMSKAEQEIASLVEQLTPIERYAMNFLEASLEDISREELKQAEEQVEAARKDIDQAKDEVVFKLPEDEDENYLVEEGSAKKSKKGKGANRLAAERTGTRMSERLRNTRLPPRDGSSGDGEPPQVRLPNLRHPQAVTDEDEDSLPQVAQHTRGAAVRRELGREEKSAQLFPNPRRAGARREEPWTKAVSAGEKVPKIAPHRTEASPAGDRVLRANPHRTEIPSVGDKLLQATPQKPDPGAIGDRILKSSPPKTEAQLAGDNRLRPSTQQPTDSGLDKALKGGPQKPENPPGLVNLPPSSPRCDAPISDAQVSQLQADALDGKVPKLKPAAVSQGQEGTPQLCLPVPKLQTTKNVPRAQVPASQSQGGLVTAKLLDTETVSDIEKALEGIPAPKEKGPEPVALVAAQELPGESKREGACEVDLPLKEPKEALPRPGQETEISASSSTAQPEALNSLDEARSPPAVRETINVGNADKVAMEAVPCRSSEDLLPQATDGDAATSEDKAPQREMPVPGCPEHSTTAAASPLLQLESRAFAKEPNGPEQLPKPGDLPCPLPGSREEISPRRVALPTAEAASGEADSSRESPKRGQGLAEKKLPEEEDQKNKACPGTLVVQESSPGSGTSPGTLSLDESLSPIKTPRRRTSADVQIQQSCQDQEGPAAKVLRKLPGRLVTVVEEKELIRRRRNRMRKLEAASSATVSPSDNSAQSVSEPETSPSAKELPSLRDLPARRRIELESRAAAKEKEEGSRGEGLPSPSTEPVKRKRGRPPKNKSPEQPSPGVSQSFLEPTALETNLQSKAPESQSHSDKASEEKVAKSQPKRKTSEHKAPKTSTPKNKSPKTKAESSENDSPAEKRRRGRPQGARLFCHVSQTFCF